MLNLTHYREAISPEERDFWGAQELSEEAELPLSRESAFEFLEGRVFQSMWIDDEFPW